MRLDEKTAIIGLLFGLTLLLLSSLIKMGWGLSFTLSFSTLVYLFLSRRKSVTVTSPLLAFHKGKKSYIFLITITIGIVIFLIYSVTCLLYHRPLKYFLIASVLSAIIGFEVCLFTSSSNASTWLILIQILLLATSLRWGITFEFPGFVGVDPWYHSFLVRCVVNNGRLFEISQAVFPWDKIAASYNHFPFMHIVISITHLVTSLPIKESMIFSVGTFEIVSIIFVFLVARRFLRDVRSALFAALMLGISSWHLTWGFWLIPMSMGLGFFALIIWLSFDKHIRNVGGRRLTAIILLLISSMILTHTASSFILLLVLLTTLFAQILYVKGFSAERIPKKALGVSLTLFALVSTITRWTYGSNFLIERMRILVNEVRLAEIAKIRPVTRSYIHFELDNLGVYIFYALAIVGCLPWLREEHRNLARFKFVATTFVIFSTMYVLPFFGISSILPGRWFAFLFIIIALPASEGLIRVGKSLRWKHVLAVSLLMFSLTFLMITSSAANIDSPLYGRHDVPRYSTYLNSEMEAANVANILCNHDIYVDAYYTGYFHWVLRREVIIMNFSTAKFSFTDGVVLRRMYIYEQPTPLYEGGPSVTVNRTLEKLLEQMNKVYCNEEVAGYTPIWNAST